MPLKPILRNDASIYDLLIDGGLTWRDGKRYLNDPDSGVVMGGGGANDARVMFKEYYEVHKAQGKSDDQFMKQSFFDAQVGQALWLGHAGAATDRCQSRSMIRIPQGAFMQTKSALNAFGKMLGHGPSQFWTNGSNLDKWSGTKAQGGTELIVDHEKWSGAQTDNQIQGSTWGLEGFYGYQESFGLGNLFLNGAKRSFNYDPSRQIGGIGMFDSGSASNAGEGAIQIKHHEGPSMTFARGTPAFAGRIVAMYSNTCAVDLVGDGIFHFQDLEVDAAPSVFRFRDGFGRKAGGALKVDFVKIEDGHDEHPNSSRPIETSTALVDMISPGWVDILFDLVAGSSKVFNADLMRLNCPLGNNTSSVRVNLLREFGGIHCLVHDVANKKAWNTDHGTNYSASFQTRVKSFSWHNWNGGELFTGPGEAAITPVSRPNPWRLDGQKQDPMTGNVPQWNDQAGTPKYDFVPEAGTPADVPVIDNFGAIPVALTAAGNVELSWNTTNATSVSISGVTVALPVDGKTMVNVTATTTFTLTAKSAAGLITTATTTVTLTAAPPSGTKWTSPWPVPLTMIPTTHYPIPSVVATQVVLTDFTPSALNYLRIVGTGTESLQLWPDGKFRWGNTVCAVSPAGNMAVGKKVTVTITLPSAKTLTDAWQVSKDQGGAQTGSCGTMTLK